MTISYLFASEYISWPHPPAFQICFSFISFIFQLYIRRCGYRCSCRKTWPLVVALLRRPTGLSPWWIHEANSKICEKYRRKISQKEMTNHSKPICSRISALSMNLENWKSWNSRFEGFQWSWISVFQPSCSLVFSRWDCRPPSASVELRLLAVAAAPLMNPKRCSIGVTVSCSACQWINDAQHRRWNSALISSVNA